MARYRFGVFELDEGSGELTRAGRRIHLAPQPMRALALFLARAGTLVTREELRRALWDDTTFVEFDQGLSFAVGRIRVVLGDDARSPRFLETLPRRGFRFVAPVERFEAPPPAPPMPARALGLPPTASTPSVPPAARSGDRRMWMRAAAAALFAILAVSSPGVVPRHEPAPEARAAFRRGQAARAGQRRESLGAFREAVRLDPAFAEAHFAIASIYTDLAESGELPAAQAFPIARAEAERALALEEVADSHLLRGTALFLYDWDRAQARHEFERAVELEPAANLVHTAQARLLSAAGEHAAALAPSVARRRSTRPATSSCTKRVGSSTAPAATPTPSGSSSAPPPWARRSPPTICPGGS